MRQISAGAVLAGAAISLIGTAWDVQWHVDVGPDTFFTLPHLMLYSGSAISGIAALAMVVRATVAERAGRSAGAGDGGRPIRVLGVFRAPIGYLVSGVGAAMFLLYGLMDLWWHSIYGFDATLASPPHIALFSSITVTMVGAIIVYGYAARERGGRIGLTVAVATLMAFSPIVTNAFKLLPLPFNAMTAGVSLFCTVCLVVTASLVRRAGAALLAAGTMAAVQVVLWFVAPWAAHTYAIAVGLPLRDNLGQRPPELPSAMPLFLLVAAAAIELMLWLGRSPDRTRRWVAPTAGAIGGALTSTTFALQIPLLGVGPAPTAGGLAAALLAGALLGALAGFAGWRFGEMLRVPATAPASSAPIAGTSEETH
jgi:hypothetical protein